MKKKITIKKATFIALAALTCASYAAPITYTWTGATDGNWSNSANWGATGIPADNDNDPGLTFLDPASKIVFNAATVPTLNVPDFGGQWNQNTPALELISGGTLFITGGMNPSPSGNTSTATRDVFTVGGGASAVTLNYSFGVGYELNRYASGSIATYRVGANGTLFLSSVAKSSIQFSNNADRNAVLSINGGTVSIDEELLNLKDFTGSYVDFIAVDGSLTAKFGSDFADIAAVTAAIGDSFRSSNGKTVVAVDNGNGSFTVGTGGVAPPDPALTHIWTGATDGNWSNGANWGATGMPVDSYSGPGLTFSENDRKIVFSASNMPTVNVPNLGHRYLHITPALEVTSGGTLNLTGGYGGFGGIGSLTDRTVFTIGGGANPVTLNFHIASDGTSGSLIKLNRWAPSEGSTVNYLVESNGLWRLTTASNSISFAHGEIAGRESTITINGGTVDFSTLILTNIVTETDSYVDFTDTGSFTAKFGNELVNLSAVNAQIGDSFKSTTGRLITAADNGDGTFTVTAAPEGAVVPSTIVGWSNLPGNIMQLVVKTPSASENYSPKAKESLLLGTWDAVPHSDDGVNPFIITNLSYSTTDGSNDIIYVETPVPTKFIRIEH